MPSYAVESSKQPMAATGIVEPLMEWVEVGGKRQQSDSQSRHEGTGMPLWGLEVMYRTSSWGREETVTAKVIVGAEVQPEPRPYSAVVFANLHADVYVKAGRLVERWSAESIASMTSDAKPIGKPDASKTDAGKSSGDNKAA